MDYMMETKKFKRRCGREEQDTLILE